MSGDPVIVWLRQDLRLADNAALVAAAERRKPVIPVFILDDDSPGRWRMGGASRWWLHHSLANLGRAIGRCGGRLVLKRGAAEATLLALAHDTGARTVFWNRHVEPHWRGVEMRLTERFDGEEIETASFDAITTLFPTGSVVGRDGAPLKVFTPFWRACLAHPPPASPLPAPERLPAPAAPPTSDLLETWSLLPRSPDWAGGLRDAWQAGEDAALARLGDFLGHGLPVYARQRDRPEPTGTSQLSPHLHFGEISPRQVWHATQARAAGDPAVAGAGESFLRELGWREFCAATLVEHPEMVDEPLQARYRDFPWRRDERLLAGWQRGLTGYPIVDAGMRQLWRIGWMHNRVRMIVASFLIKHLLQPWQDGEAWFWDTLVDADMASNAGNWQWVAGCGRDAAPYFRIFNPVMQGSRFDADGAYVRRWVPELSRLSDRWIHRPWDAPAHELAAVGVRLGFDYPNRLVDHSVARGRALAAYQVVKPFLNARVVDSPRLER